MVLNSTCMYETMALSKAELQAVVLSVQVAFYCSLIALPLALTVGYVMARHHFWGKSVIESIIHLPLVMPPVTTGYLLLLILGSNGMIGGWFYDVFHIKLAFTFQASVIASLVVSFPLFVRSVRTAIEMVDPGLEEASRILGAGRFQDFFSDYCSLVFTRYYFGNNIVFCTLLG